VNTAKPRKGASRGGTPQLDGFDVWRRVSSWRELVKCETDLDSSRHEWIFRGHSSSSWSLDSTLERACSAQGVKTNEVAQIEEDLLIDFWRYYDLHSIAPPPADDDTLAWLSLMRHYGTPTRLTDFTRSLFIAAYFALEHATEESAIWAISKTWLTKRTHDLIRKMNDKTLLEDWGNRVGDAFDRIFFRSPPQCFVSAASPAKMHERLAIQQSIFLCPGDVTASFLDNLHGMEGSAENVRPIILSAGTRKDEIPGTPREQILLKLMRVGIDRSSLFPGLDGFAQSMHSKILVFRKLRAMQSQGARLSPNIRWKTKRSAAPTAST
jgi:FRG domain